MYKRQFELVAEFDPQTPVVAIIKHANPCGVAQGDSLEQAYQLALRCDPVSAFGGIIAMNRPLDAKSAAAMTEIFTEVIIAPGVDEDALEILAKKKNLRLLITNGLPDSSVSAQIIKPIAGGFCASHETMCVLAGMICKSSPKESQMRASLTICCLLSKLRNM